MDMQRNNWPLVLFLLYLYTCCVEATVTTTNGATVVNDTIASKRVASALTAAKASGSTRGRPPTSDESTAVDVGSEAPSSLPSTSAADANIFRLRMVLSTVCDDGSFFSCKSRNGKRFVSDTSFIRGGGGGGGGEASQHLLRAGAVPVNRRGLPPEEALSRYPTLGSAGGLVRALDYVGTVSFAMSGAAMAGMRGMNLLGCLVVGTLAAIGGGTTRDLLLGQTPVFWLEETEYVGICVTTSLATFVLWPILSRMTILSSMGTGMDGWLSQALDTVGLGSFCVVGTQHGIRRGLHPLTTVVICCITCSGGGVMRDILTASPVTVLTANAQMYVTTAAIGSVAYLMARRRSRDPLQRISAGFFCVVILRFLASSYNIRLPAMV